MDLEGVNRGNVEKSRQRGSRHVAVLTYCEYAPRVNRAAALLGRTFLLIPVGCQSRFRLEHVWTM